VSSQAPSRQVIVAEAVHTPLGYSQLRQAVVFGKDRVGKNYQVCGWFVEHTPRHFPAL